MQNRIRGIYILMALVVCSGCGHLSRFSATEEHMGAPVTITAYATDAQQAERAFAAAFARIAELNGSFSDYLADSELRRLGRDAAVGHPQPISDDLFHILAEARRIGTETDGAFNVAAGPTILLWRLARARHQLPDSAKLAIARQRSRPANWRLDPDQQTVTLATRGMRFDLGGIAKGYAADAALAVLAEHGIRRALVDAGGDLALAGPPPDRRGWRIRINGDDGAALLLANCGVATSGDTSRYLEIDGTRYSHLIDPRTGVGMTNRALVTVVAPNGMLADAAASAVTVLGAEVGMRWAASRGAAVRYQSLVGHAAIHRSGNWPTEHPAPVMP